MTEGMTFQKVLMKEFGLNSDVVSAALVCVPRVQKLGTLYIPRKKALTALAEYLDRRVDENRAKDEKCQLEGNGSPYFARLAAKYAEKAARVRATMEAEA